MTRWTALLLGISLIACTAAPSPAADADAGQAADAGPAPTSAWLRGATIYEIFTRSYADSDGDGIGDLDGITAHLGHLRGDPGALDVDAIWLTPVHWVIRLRP